MDHKSNLYIHQKAKRCIYPQSKAPNALKLIWSRIGKSHKDALEGTRERLKATLQSNDLFYTKLLKPVQFYENLFINVPVTCDVGSRRSLRRAQSNADANKTNEDILNETASEIIVEPTFKNRDECTTTGKKTNVVINDVTNSQIVNELSQNVYKSNNCIVEIPTKETATATSSKEESSDINIESKSENVPKNKILVEPPTNVKLTLCRVYGKSKRVENEFNNETKIKPMTDVLKTTSKTFNSNKSAENDFYSELPVEPTADIEKSSCHIIDKPNENESTSPTYNTSKTAENELYNKITLKPTVNSELTSCKVNDESKTADSEPINPITDVVIPNSKISDKLKTVENESNNETKIEPMTDVFPTTNITFKSAENDFYNKMPVEPTADIEKPPCQINDESKTIENKTFNQVKIKSINDIIQSTSQTYDTSKTAANEITLKPTANFELTSCKANERAESESNYEMKPITDVIQPTCKISEKSKAAEGESYDIIIKPKTGIKRQISERVTTCNKIVKKSLLRPISIDKLKAKPMNASGEVLIEYPNNEQTTSIILAQRITEDNNPISEVPKTGEKESIEVFEPTHINNKLNSPTIINGDIGIDGQKKTISVVNNSPQKLITHENIPEFKTNFYLETLNSEVSNYSTEPSNMINKSKCSDGDRSVSLSNVNDDEMSSMQIKTDSMSSYDDDNLIENPHEPSIPLTDNAKEPVLDEIIPASAIKDEPMDDDDDDNDDKTKMENTPDSNQTNDNLVFSCPELDEFLANEMEFIENDIFKFARNEATCSQPINQPANDSITEENSIGGCESSTIEQFKRNRALTPIESLSKKINLFKKIGDKSCFKSINSRTKNRSTIVTTKGISVGVRTRGKTICLRSGKFFKGLLGSKIDLYKVSKNIGLTVYPCPGFPLNPVARIHLDKLREQNCVMDKGWASFAVTALATRSPSIFDISKRKIIPIKTKMTCLPHETVIKNFENSQFYQNFSYREDLVDEEVRDCLSTVLDRVAESVIPILPVDKLKIPLTALKLKNILIFCLFHHKYLCVECGLERNVKLINVDASEIEMIKKGLHMDMPSPTGSGSRVAYKSREKTISDANFSIKYFYNYTYQRVMSLFDSSSQKISYKDLREFYIFELIEVYMDKNDIYISPKYAVGKPNLPNIRLQSYKPESIKAIFYRNYIQVQFCMLIPKQGTWLCKPEINRTNKLDKKNTLTCHYHIHSTYLPLGFQWLVIHKDREFDEMHFSKHFKIQKPKILNSHFTKCSKYKIGCHPQFGVYQVQDCATFFFIGPYYGEENQEIKLFCKKVQIPLYLRAAYDVGQGQWDEKVIKRCSNYLMAGNYVVKSIWLLTVSAKRSKVILNYTEAHPNVKKIRIDNLACNGLSLGYVPIYYYNSTPFWDIAYEKPVNLNEINKELLDKYGDRKVKWYAYPPGVQMTMERYDKEKARKTLPIVLQRADACNMTKYAELKSCSNNPLPNEWRNNFEQPTSTNSKTKEIYINVCDDLNTPYDIFFSSIPERSEQISHEHSYSSPDEAKSIKDSSLSNSWSKPRNSLLSKKKLFNEVNTVPIESENSKPSSDTDDAEENEESTECNIDSSSNISFNLNLQHLTVTKISHKEKKKNKSRKENTHNSSKTSDMVDKSNIQIQIINRTDSEKARSKDKGFSPKRLASKRRCSTSDEVGSMEQHLITKPSICEVLDTNNRVMVQKHVGDMKKEYAVSSQELNSKHVRCSTSDEVGSMEQHLITKPSICEVLDTNNRVMVQKHVGDMKKEYAVSSQELNSKHVSCKVLDKRLKLNSGRFTKPASRVGDMGKEFIVYSQEGANDLDSPEAFEGKVLKSNDTRLKLVNITSLSETAVAGDVETVCVANEEEVITEQSPTEVMDIANITKSPNGKKMTISKRIENSEETDMTEEQIANTISCHEGSDGQGKGMIGKMIKLRTSKSLNREKIIRTSNKNFKIVKRISTLNGEQIVLQSINKVFHYGGKESINNIQSPKSRTMLAKEVYLNRPNTSKNSNDLAPAINYSKEICRDSDDEMKLDNVGKLYKDVNFRKISNLSPCEKYIRTSSRKNMFGGESIILNSVDDMRIKINRGNQAIICDVSNEKVINEVVLSKLKSLSSEKYAHKPAILKDNRTCRVIKNFEKNNVSPSSKNSDSEDSKLKYQTLHSPNSQSEEQVKMIKKIGEVSIIPIYKHEEIKSNESTELKINSPKNNTKLDGLPLRQEHDLELNSMENKMLDPPSANSLSNTNSGCHQAKPNIVIKRKKRFKHTPRRNELLSSSSKPIPTPIVPPKI